MAIDLPIDDVKVKINEVLLQLGVDCEVDTISTKIMTSDLEVSRSLLEKNIKLSVVEQSIVVSRGSRVDFLSGELTGKAGIVYEVPNDDLVSKTLKVLLFNQQVEVIRKQDAVYNLDGDIVANEGYDSIGYQDCYVEKMSAYDRDISVGINHETMLKLVTFSSVDVTLLDRIKVKDRVFRVIDIDDYTDGIYTIQLGSVLNG